MYKRLGGVVGVMAFAGFTAGLLGIGGALIFNPVLLQLGVQPQVIHPTRYPPHYLAHHMEPPSALCSSCACPYHELIYFTCQASCMSVLIGYLHTCSHRSATLLYPCAHGWHCLCALAVAPFPCAFAQVTASTSVLMILFTSSAIALSFYFQGLLNTSYALVLAPLCFLASLTGRPCPEGPPHADLFTGTRMVPYQELWAVEPNSHGWPSAQLRCTCTET